MPASRSDFSSASCSNSFKPTKDTVATIARSSMTTTTIWPSTSMRTSLNSPVANSARSAVAPFSSV